MVDSNADSNAGDSAPSAHADAVDPAVQRAFLLSVLEANVALVALALGVLFVTVAQRIVIGSVALAVGIAATGGLYWRIRTRPTSDARSPADPDTET
ncbi:DUF7322 domain-containing protein [Halococcoides cellulosivorans]|uniref:DUF7322 domain-containing protein n=1 Tax=Halococcoides cellulosivorans TaxID=1679096 RepID=A0A2R4X0W5_9EURY|nr:hypothetical protein [Halococcoides cellulosivorans]AWB27440.1 hypothetical protein HARCEL1_06840 [Halococcoides cellulosivorans]